jgi:hypothetical protein
VRLKKRARYAALAERALADLEGWMAAMKSRPSAARAASDVAAALGAH